MKPLVLKTVHVCLLLLVFACAKKLKVTNPPEGSLVFPEYFDASQFLLNTELTLADKEYAGGLVIWNPNVQRGDIAELLTATKSYNQSISEISKYVEQGISSNVLPKVSQVKSLESEILIQKSKNYQEDFIVTAQWVDNQIAALESFVSAQELERFWDRFGLYCEAKTLELASSDLVSSAKLSKRPSPGLLCENVFKKKGFFEYEGSEDALSTCSESDSGKLFSDCIWRFGVLKTSFAKNGFAGQDPTFGKAGSTYDNVADLEALKSLSKAGTLANVYDVSNPLQCVAPNILQWLLSPKNCNLGSTPGGACLQSCGGIQETQLRLVGLNRYGGQTPLNLLSIFPQSYLQAFEKFNGSAPSTPILKAIHGIDWLSATPNFVAVYTKILDAVKSFQGTTVAKVNGFSTIAINESLWRFSVPKIVQWDNRQIEEIEAKDIPGYEPLQIFNTSNVSDLEIRLVTARQDLANQKLQYCDSDSSSSLLSGFQPYLNAQKFSTQKLEISRKPSVSIVLIKEFLLSFKQQDNQIVTKLGFARDTLAEGCFSNFEEGKSVACRVDAANSKNVTFTFDPTQKKLHFEKILEAKDLGIFVDGQENLQVNDLVTQEFAGKVLSIDFYFNVLNNQIPFWSGNVKVLDGSKEVFRGTASYLMDLKKASVASLCQAAR